MKRILFLLLIIPVFLTGCISGTGFFKKGTLMPDEFSIGGDVSPDGKIVEFEWGYKWKLK